MASLTSDGTIYVLVVVFLLFAGFAYILKYHFSDNITDSQTVQEVLWDTPRLYSAGLMWVTIFLGILIVLRVIADFGIIPGGHTGCLFC